jgi:uncharacterized membrane protein (UPF0127 family)
MPESISAMFKRKFFLGLFFLGYFLLSTPPAHAAYDPLIVPNNRLGIHILDPNEIIEASKLVNSTGGDWGYVTIPMRSNDRLREKWLPFFQACKNLHLIPIIRLSTYPVGSVWEKPSSYDLVAFANFLNDMPWPTANRYVSVFNEPNHSYEWGGEVNAQEYVHMLVDAKHIFSSRSADFFLLSAGLDMSAPNSATSTEALNFYRQMFAYQPHWPNFVDGIAVHAYPNPGFVAPVNSKTKTSLVSYRYELNLLKSYGVGQKPIFITETGTKSNQNFFPYTFNYVWTDPEIVAITPFLLFASTPDFRDFSFLDTNHQPKPIYYHFLHTPKLIGSPYLAQPSSPPVLTPISPPQTTYSPPSTNNFFNFMKSLFSFSSSPSVTISGHTFPVELATTPAQHQQGLSNRADLPSGTGMLFVFSSPGRYQFWMKDMRFPLDFVWIANGAIVQLNQNVPHPHNSANLPEVIDPLQPIDMVLELPAGDITKFNLKISDAVTLNQP